MRATAVRAAWQRAPAAVTYGVHERELMINVPANIPKQMIGPRKSMGRTKSYSTRMNGWVFIRFLASAAPCLSKPSFFALSCLLMTSFTCGEARQGVI